MADLYRSCSRRWPLYNVSITLANQLISKLSLTTIGSLKIGLITNPRRLSRFNWKMSLHVTKHPFLDKNQSLNWTQEKKPHWNKTKKVKYMWKTKTNICIREKCKWRLDYISHGKLLEKSWWLQVHLVFLKTIRCTKNVHKYLGEGASSQSWNNRAEQILQTLRGESCPRKWLKWLFH